MQFNLFTVLFTLTYINFCLGDTAQEHEHFQGDRSVDFLVIEHNVEPRNVSFNCSYAANDALFINMTISKYNNVFYTLDNKNNSVIFPVEGMANVTVVAPGVIQVHNTTDLIEGNYSCTVFFNASQRDGIFNMSANVNVHFVDESPYIAKDFLEVLNTTFQLALNVSNQLHQLSNGKNELLKQEILKELNRYTIRLSYDDEFDASKKAEFEGVGLFGEYLSELYDENSRLFVKFAQLSKLEVNKN